MAKRKTRIASLNPPESYIGPPAECPSYIPAEWHQFAVRADSLVIDVEENVKLHGDKDLAAQQASLKDWGFTRLVVVRRENRQVVIGNGSVLAAMRNGWDYVPAIFKDLTATQARALGAADNMLGTVADWNEKAIEKLLAEMPEFELPELSLDLDQLCGDVLGRLKVIEEDGSAGESAVVEEQAASDGNREPVADARGSEGAAGKKVDISLSRRIIVTCATEAAQIELIGELINRGYECRVSTVRAN